MHDRRGVSETTRWIIDSMRTKEMPAGKHAVHHEQAGVNSVSFPNKIAQDIARQTWRDADMHLHRWGTREA